MRIELSFRTYLIAVCAVAGLVSAPANAGDLIAGPALDSTSEDPTWWTGVHIGGGIGGAAFNSRWTTDCLASLALPATCPNDIFGGATRIDNDNPADFDNSAVRLNFYLGLDWQVSSRLVVGVEGEAALLDSVASQIGIPGTWPTDFGPGLNAAWIEDRWDASLRARIGFLLTPKTLFYTTGGLTILREDVSANCDGTFPVGWCSVANADSKSATVYGWTAGGGVERMIAPAWIVRGEYRYSVYGSRSFTLFDDVSLDSVDITVRQKASIAYVGLSRRF